MSLLKSRFIEMFIEKRYPTASLDELSICGGEYGAQSSAIEYHPNRPRYVRITDINEDGSLNNDYASSANIKDDEQYRLKYGDFLFARMGATVGKTYAYTFGDQIYAGYLIRYRLNLEKILPEYLFAFTRLNCYWKWVSINQNGAAQPGINAKKYGSLYVPVPPIEEQKKFIELSQQIDKSKFLLQQILKKLELLKKSRFIEMFKNSETLRLDQIAEVTMGQSPDSSSYNSVGKGIPFYQGKTEFTDKYIGQPSTWCTSPTRIAKENDILMSVRAPVGNVNIATEECCIGRGLSSIRPQNGFNSEFIFEALEQKKEELENKATGSTFKAINKDIVLSIQIPNTSISIQKEYSNFVKQIDKSKFNVFQDQTASQVKVIVVLHHIC